MIFILYSLSTNSYPVSYVTDSFPEFPSFNSKESDCSSELLVYNLWYFFICFQTNISWFWAQLYLLMFFTEDPFSWALNDTAHSQFKLKSLTKTFLFLKDISHVINSLHCLSAYSMKYANILYNSSLLMLALLGRSTFLIGVVESWTGYVFPVRDNLEQQQSQNLS